MQIEIKIDENCPEIKVLVICDKMTQEVSQLVEKLSYETPKIIFGIKDDKVEILSECNIISIYTCDKKVFITTDKGEYLVKMRLYEIEERLDKNSFVRISNGEIINIKKAKNFDLSFTGTICVTLTNGKVTYVSRRYVTKIKQILGI
ncbi:MAG: LytTR family DNA-binding domain-containing protein [Erysipelotrichaceae bacterium]